MAELRDKNVCLNLKMNVSRINVVNGSRGSRLEYLLMVSMSLVRQFK